jgi:3-oxoacyl-[acyl-carrier-protein] synthase II
VTGCGVLVGGARSPGELFGHLRADRPVPGTMPDDSEAAAAALLSPGEAGVLARHQILALAATTAAWKAAGLGTVSNPLRGEGPRKRNPRAGCVAGSSLGGLNAMELDREKRQGSKISPYALARWRGNACSAVVSMRFGLGGIDLNLNAASATGGMVLLQAASLVSSRVLDLAVAVASDAAPAGLVAEAMKRNGSVTRGAGRPLDREREGMSPVEGAACLILESEEHLAARGAAPMAEWIHGAAANEAYHLTAPDPEAMALGSLLEGACRTAGTPDWISLHATGTRRFDSVECACVRRIFHDTPPWISAIKRTTGHALGASGLLEAALLVEGLRSRQLPAWPKEIDPNLGLDQPAMPPPAPRTALAIGQGMGGSVVVNVLAAAG